MRYALWAVTAVSIMSAWQVASQEQPAFATIPVDRASPEVLELQNAMRELSLPAPTGEAAPTVASDAVQSLAERLGRSPAAALLSLPTGDEADEVGGGDDFFAVIDVPQIARAARENRSAVMASEAVPADVDSSLQSVESRTMHAPPGQGWFSTSYPEVNANLRCDWTYNPAFVQALGSEESKAREAELEERYRAEELDSDNPDRAAEGEAAEPVTADPDGTGEGEVGIERQFQIAGRPCLLTFLCGGEGVPCSQEAADELVENVILVRTGEE
jgi:hypothetical protein